MNTELQIPAVILKRLARAALAATSNDDVTPVITGAVLSAADGQVTTIATDRYRVHRAHARLDGLPDFDPVLIPRRALSWAVTNSSFFGRGGLVDSIATINVELNAEQPPATKDTRPTICPRGQITITVLQANIEGAERVSYTADLIAGNFPPVHTILDAALAAEPIAYKGLFDLDFMSKARALASYPGERPDIRFTSNNDTKPAQIVVTYSEGAALIQGASHTP